MPDVRLPNGYIIKNVPEGTPKDVIKQKAISSGLAMESDFPQATIEQPQQESASSEAIETADLPELQTSGILSTAPDKLELAAKTPAMLTATDPEEIAQIVKSIDPDNIGIQYQKAPNGNVYPIVTNNKTGVSSVINRPGLSPLDVMQGVGLLAAYTPAGKATSVANAALKGAATGATIEGAQAASGGDFSAKNVALDAAFGGAGKGLEKIIGTAFRAIKGRASKSVDELIDFAKEQGLPISTTDVAPPQTFPGKSSQALGEKIPLVGTGKMQATKQEARVGLLDDLSKRYGTPLEDEVFDSFVRQGAKAKEAASKRYKQISSQMADTPIMTSKTVKAFDDAIEKLTKKGSFKDPETANKLMQLKKDLLEAPQTFDSLKQNRTLFRENVRGERVNFPQTSDRVVNDIYKSMTDNLRLEVKKSLGNEASSKWMKANQYLFNEAEVLKKTKLKNILNKGEVTPEVAQNIIFSKNPSEVKALFYRLDPKGREAGRAAIVSRAIEKAGGSPEKFMSRMKEMDSQVGVFFKGNEKKFINGVAKYLEATREAGQAAVRTKSGQELVTPAIYTSIGLDLASTGGIGTASAATYGIMARAYESKPIRTLMTRLAGTKRGTTAFEKVLSTLNSELTKIAQSQKEQRSDQ